MGPVISTEINRIIANKNTIRNKLIELGLASAVSNLDALATAIESIIKRGAVSVNVKEGETYTIPAGYHDGSGTVSGVAGGGNYNLQSKSVTPTKKQQAITADSGYYGLSDVTLGAIPDAYQDVSEVNLTAADALVGKIFVAADGSIVTGTMPNNGDVNKTLDVTTVTYIIPEGKHSGRGKVTITLEEKTATPTKSTQVIVPTAGKVLSKVTFNPIPDAYQDVTGVTATAAHVLDGDVFVDKAGAQVEGNMPNNGAVNGTIDGVNTTSITVPEGYTSGGIVSFDETTIAEMLAAI